MTNIFLIVDMIEPLLTTGRFPTGWTECSFALSRCRCRWGVL